jgi:hypothetical protein
MAELPKKPGFDFHLLECIACEIPARALVDTRFG